MCTLNLSTVKKVVIRKKVVTNERKTTPCCETTAWYFKRGDAKELFEKSNGRSGLTAFVGFGWVR